MAVLKEFYCKAHGAFEEFVKSDRNPKCPKGCSPRFVTREFRTAPSIRGVATGRMDGLQREIAHDFGLSDLKVGRDDGKSLMENLRSGTDFSTRWVDVPGKSAAGQPTQISAQNFGMMDGNALAGAALPKELPTKIQGSYKGD
jgi:hypothetical protein